MIVKQYSIELGTRGDRHYMTLHLVICKPCPVGHRDVGTLTTRSGNPGAGRHTAYKCFLSGQPRTGFRDGTLIAWIKSTAAKAFSPACC